MSEPFEIFIKDNQEFCLVEKEELEDILMQADAFKNVREYYHRFKKYLEALQESYSLEKKEAVIDKKLLYAISIEDKGKLNMLALDYDYTSEDISNIAREIIRVQTIITTLHNLLHPEEALLNGPLLKNVHKEKNEDKRANTEAVAGS